MGRSLEINIATGDVSSQELPDAPLDIEVLRQAALDNLHMATQARFANTFIHGLPHDVFQAKAARYLGLVAIGSLDALPDEIAAQISEAAAKADAVVQWHRSLYDAIMAATTGDELVSVIGGEF